MSEQRAFTYGKQQFDYSLIRRDRKTLAITVLPDMSIEVVAPTTADDEEIEKRLKRRAGWIRQQLLFFDQFQPRTPPRKYIAGETHLYLGRRYRLKIVQSAQEQVKLKRGFLEVHAHRPSRTDLVQNQVLTWYKDRASTYFRERLEQCVARFPDQTEFEPVGLIIRQLKSRWGSMTRAGRLVLNRQLIQAAPHEIDYVITHELCHRRFHHHGPEFYSLLNRVMPVWEKRKQSLERRLI